MIVGLDHSFLTIHEGGEDEARGFYGDVLGLEEIPRPAGLERSGGIWFQAGGQELHLGTDNAHLAPGRPHPGFRVGSSAGLDELAERLVANRFGVDWDERIEGRRRFYTCDPFGNRLELLTDD